MIRSSTFVNLRFTRATNDEPQNVEHRLANVEVTHIPALGDDAGLRRLGVNLTSDPNFSSKCLFVS